MSRTRKKIAAPTDDLPKILRTSILEIVNNEKSTTADKLKALELGVKLAAIERKGGKDDDAEGFFNKR